MKAAKKLTIVIVLIFAGLLSNGQEPVTPKDTVYSVADVDVKPEYPGGDIARRDFFEKKTNLFVPMDNGAPKGTYNVVIVCIINTDGKIIAAVAETNNGYRMEAEIIRVINKLPKLYRPGFKNGVPVKTKIRFPAIFSVS